MSGLQKFPKFKGDALSICDISLFSKLVYAVPLQEVAGRNTSHKNVPCCYHTQVSTEGNRVKLRSFGISSL